jgi:hypothetical protein
MEDAVAVKVDIEETQRNIGKLQSVIDENKNKINRAVSVISGELELLPMEDFWKVIEKLNDDLKGYDGIYKITKSGLEKFANNSCFGHLRDIDTDHNIMLRFIKTYEELCGKIYTALYNVIEGFGDDSYGDIIDSFPLFGEESVNKALDGEIEGSSEDQYQGENYVKTTLRDTIYEKYAIACKYEHSKEDEE